MRSFSYCCGEKGQHPARMSTGCNDKRTRERSIMQLDCGKTLARIHETKRWTWIQTGNERDRDREATITGRWNPRRAADKLNYELTLSQPIRMSSHSDEEDTFTCHSFSHSLFGCLLLLLPFLFQRPTTCFSLLRTHTRLLPVWMNTDRRKGSLESAWSRNWWKMRNSIVSASLSFSSAQQLWGSSRKQRERERERQRERGRNRERAEIR